MPIKPENKHRYPSNWKSIRQAVLAAADNKCMFCYAENYRPHPKTGSKVVLTIAHLDQQPENNSADNLRALCQRCHLSWDRAFRRALKSWNNIGQRS